MVAAESISDDRVRETVHEVVSRSPYAEWRPRGQYAWLDQILRWLQAFSEWFNNLVDVSPLLSLALIAGLFLLTFLLVAHLVYTIRRAIIAVRPAATSADRAPAASLLDEASVLARDGHFLAAAQKLQLAVIELLLVRRRLDLVRSETNRVLRRRLVGAGLPAHLRDEMTLLLDRLERQWFRDRQEDRELYEAWSRLHDAVALLPEAQ